MSFFFFFDTKRLMSCILGPSSFDCIDPLVAEARTALLAAKMVNEVGFNAIILEGDTLLVIQVIQ